MEKDYVYDQNGASSRCYAITPEGIEYVPCSWKVHRKYGTEVKRVSREIAMNYWTKKEGFPKTSRLPNDPSQTFFSPDGTPLMWYYQNSDGKIDLFSLPGIHPQLGVQLYPISKEIVEALKRQRDDHYREMSEFEAREKRAREDVKKRYAELLHKKYQPIFIESRKRMGVIDNNGRIYDLIISDDGESYQREGDPTLNYHMSGLQTESPIR